MPAPPTPPGGEIVFRDEALELRVRVGADGVARLVRLAARPGVEGPTAGTEGGVAPSDPDGTGAESEEPFLAGLPLLDVITAGSGRAWSGHRYVESETGGRLRFAGGEQRSEGPWREMSFQLEDPQSGLRAEVVYRVLAGRGVLCSRARLVNAGERPLTVESVTSFVASGLAGPGGVLDDVDIWWGENDWLSENRWQHRAFRDALPDLDRGLHGADSRAMFGVTSEGGWSCAGHLPMGAAVNRSTGHAFLWQIEHNGGWHWQVGEHAGRGDPQPGAIGPRSSDAAAAYVALLGPTDAEHHWRLVLEPGESFETVPAAVALSAAGFEGAVARLTGYRRAARRARDDHKRLPVVFNDYMNTVMGDPTTERLLPLVEAAARAGAEYFCLDSGWYAELGESWWESVGEWKPSTSRFPKGIEEVLDAIREHGMVPGLWLEPEVVGVQSAVASQLPDAAFFCRGGERVVEQDRYHLDLRHPAARKHLDEVVEFLVGGLGVGYLKFDYNVDVGPGTDTGGVAEGVGMLGHNRALLDWLDAVLDRHSALTIENCASGGLRSDFAMLSRLQVQSTSDQQDYLRYPAISVAAPVAFTPEQAASWAYPQPEWSDDEIAFTLCSALLGRIHLSGHLDQMSPSQLALVADAVAVYKRIRHELPTAVPFWPLGLPSWTDSWFALGMRGRAATYVLAWHRGALSRSGGVCAEEESATLRAPHLRNSGATGKLLYPALGGGDVSWDDGRGELTVGLPRAPSACLVELRTK
ncbi:MAG: alpha-galactosidase [Acidimicrobiales bacterium]|jgi:alpha-galactosidase